MERSIILENERLDEIGFNGLKLIQNPEEFCYGIDAVILSDFVASNTKKKGNIIDLGTGTAIIPLILSHKMENMKIIGVEKQKYSADRAIRNVNINNLKERISIINDDILNIDKAHFDTYDIVVTNPPYMVSNASLKNENVAKMIARHETSANLEDFFRIADKLLKDRGELFMVHRPSRLADLISYGRKYRLEPKIMRMVNPSNEKAPNIILLKYIKGGGKELNVMKDLIVYKDNGEYTDEILKIYEKNYA